MWIRFGACGARQFHVATTFRFRRLSCCSTWLCIVVIIVVDAVPDVVDIVVIVVVVVVFAIAPRLHKAHGAGLRYVIFRYPTPHDVQKLQ